jgi:hypothetical protein
LAHNGGEDEGLPATWPFRAAGTLVIFAMIWFTLGFGMEDVTGDHLAGHMSIFWALLVAAAVLIAGGAAFNIARERRRRHG